MLAVLFFYEISCLFAENAFGVDWSFSRPLWETRGDVVNTFLVARFYCSD